MNETALRWPATVPLLTGFLTAIALFGGFGAWAVLSVISGAVIASGQVEVADSRQFVAHPDGGVVVDVLVAEGAEVALGDILLRLDGTDLRAELSVVESRLLELEAMRARLSAQRNGTSKGAASNRLSVVAETDATGKDLIEGQATLLALQTEEIHQARLGAEIRIRQIRQQIDGFETQGDALHAQIALLEAELATARGLLARELTLAGRVSAMERELAALRGRIGELVSARAEALERISGVELELAANVTGYRERVESELRDVIAGQQELVARKHALLARIARLEIRAPASGIVMGLKVTRPQAVIRPAEPVLSIVPQDRPLRIVLWVQSTDIEALYPGQAVRLAFPAFPGPTTPDVFGSVVLIAADVAVEERTGLARYRAEVTIDAAQTQRLGVRKLMPGMPVQAFIKTTDRSPIAYLLRPLANYFGPAFRDH